MERFYLITPEQAAMIGRFSHGENKMFDPFEGEQEDGSFLISETSYNTLKDTEQFQRIDFSSLTIITKDQLNPKQEQ